VVDRTDDLLADDREGHGQDAWAALGVEQAQVRVRGRLQERACPRREIF
jgi:hypothetical protein